MKSALSMLVFPLCFGLLACEPVTTIVVQTDAPPGRDARIDQEDEVVRISKDVAVAIECTFYDPWATGGSAHRPCDEMHLDVEDPAMIEIMPAYLNGSVYAQGYAYAGMPVDPNGRDRAVVVLVGKKAGETSLEVSHADASFTFSLEVNTFESSDDEATSSPAP
jgi:hypothetical protein